MVGKAVFTKWLLCAVSVVFVHSSVAAQSAGPERRAADILRACNVDGGFVVHVNCGDGRLTAALRAGDAYVVHGLDTSTGDVEMAREHIASVGLYGKVSIDRYDGRRLPYIDNIANLVVVENPGDITMAELMRVLAPNGVVYVARDGTWKKTVKPRPDTIDEWTHYLHDPQGTMVGKDAVVGMPRTLQWIAGPKWLRNHDFMSSLNAMVSSNGRIFYIIDEGLRNHIYLPARWTVAARDAFNGTQLWKRSIEQWFPHTWPFKSGPGHLPRRIVADGERVYVTLGISAPLSVLDAATGKTIRTYERTGGTAEIILDEGVLFLVVDPNAAPFPYKHETPSRGKERDRANRSFGWSMQSPPRVLMAVSAGTGKVLWERDYRVAPLTLAVRDQDVLFFDGQRVLCLNRSNGRDRWVSEKAGEWVVPGTGYAPRLILGDGIVILSTKKGFRGRLVGLSAENGDILWRSDQLKSGHWSPEDVFLIDGLIWTAQTGGSQKDGTHFQAVDSRTGRVRHDFVAEQMEAVFMHQRCYPGRATERYIITSGTGTEFLELGTQRCELHHWLRGSCIYGLMPCNGLLYKPPDTCACFYQSKLAHFCALGPADGGIRHQTDRAGRLEKGDAYGWAANLESGGGASASDSWPTYRHDNGRSGAAAVEVSPKLDRLWRTKIGGRLSTVTVAGGKLFVAAIDRHTVHALSADSGKMLWSYTAGGRVDSPPTIWNGLVLFGCADGWAYCLRARDGRLVWRFRAAPSDTRLISYEQVESVWPLHGSILVHDGTAYCLAGRNMFVDGGMRLVRLDCVTGKVLSETVLDDKDPRTGKNLQTVMAGKAVPVANSDIFSFDGEHIYMGSQKFDLQGKRLDLDLVRGKERQQTGKGRHLFCPTGFLDEVWFHRSYWMFGKNAGEGHGEYPVPLALTPAGRIMVFDKSRVYYLFAHNVGNNINPRTYYSLYAALKSVSETPPVAEKKRPRRRKAAQTTTQVKSKSPIHTVWELARPELLANAMVLAGRNLFLAGPPDVADEEKTFDFVYGADDQINRQMRRQERVWLGEQGGRIAVVSADSGAELHKCTIDAIPVWDGMVAAGGRLYLALKNGNVLCMGRRD